MRILIIEDECLLAEELEDTLVRINPAFKIVAKLPSIEESVTWLQKNTCDLIFMDIQLSDGLSFSIFEKIDVTTPVIFTTAYDEYAIQAFDVNSIAYILKPIDDDEIRKALLKYEAIKKTYLGNLQKLIAENLTLNPNLKEKLTLTQGTIKKSVLVSEISHFQADGRYVFAFLDEKRYFCSYTLKELEDLLDSRSFFRINRTFIINKSSIKEWHSFGYMRIKIILHRKAFSDLIVSRQKVSNFITWMEN